MNSTEETRATAEQRLHLAQEVLAFVRQHPLRKDPGDGSSDAEVLMLAQIALSGVRNNLALLGVDA